MKPVARGVREHVQHVTLPFILTLPLIRLVDIRLLPTLSPLLLYLFVVVLFHLRAYSLIFFTPSQMSATSAMPSTITRK